MADRPKAKVCILRHGYFPEDPRVRKEAMVLKHSGFQVDVICLKGEGESAREEWQGIRIYRIPLGHKRGGMIRYLWEYAIGFLLMGLLFTRLHLKKKYDLAQVHTLPDFLIFSTLAGRLTGAKILLDLHELMPDFFYAKFKNHPWATPLRKLIEFVEDRSIKFSDHTLTVSPLLADLVRQRHGILCTIIPNVPDEGVFQETLSLEKRTNPPLVISHGTLTQGYGLQTLIQAVPYVLEKVPQARFEILGGGEYLPQLKQLRESLNLQTVVTFPGKVPLEEVPKHLARAWVGVVPLLQDGYMELLSPNKLFEYIALKIPTVSSDVPGIRAYLTEKHTLFFQPGNPKDLAGKITRLLLNEDLRREIAENAYQVYERIRWSKTKEKYVSTVLNLLKNARGRHRV